MTEEEQEKLDEALFDALDKRKSLEEIKEFIEKGANINARRIGTKSTPLITAARRGRSDAVKFLLRLVLMLTSKIIWE